MKFKRARDFGDGFVGRYFIEFDTGDTYNLSSNANMPNGGTQKQIKYLESMYTS
jgi:hypothetical protein